MDADQPRMNDVMRRQRVIADLGGRALAGEDLRALMQETAGTIADVLVVDMVEVLELPPDREHFATRGQVGWGRLQLVPVADTHVGLCVTEGVPIEVTDTATETRFGTVRFLRADHGVISGLAVPMIAGARPLGAIAVHS